MTDTSTTDTSSGTRAFAPFEWMLALRYLRARRKEGFISVIAGFSFLGILLGVATLIIVMAVMNGFRNQLFEKILGLNGHAVAYKLASVGPFDDYENLAKRLAAIPGVRSAVPLIEGQVMVSSPTNALGGLVRGMSEAGIRTLPLVANNVHLGSIDKFDAQDGIAIGTRLAQSLSVNLGDSITLISPRGADTPFGKTPRSKPYRIAAIFEMGMSEYDRTMVFMPLAEAKRFFSRGDTVDVLEIHVANAEKVELSIAAMEKEAGDAFAFSSWKQRNASFFTVLEVERTVMFIILSLIILVAALNVVSGMMMLVKDKSRDIAVLRTMGATKGAMMRVFLITGASIGGVGTFVGLIVGILFCWRIEAIRQFVQWVTGTTVMDPSVYYLTKLPADMNPKETAGIVLMALVISILATLYPSYRASKLDPVEALRYE
jgi:lipoprotein-releasing system permease protein